MRGRAYAITRATSRSAVARVLAGHMAGRLGASSRAATLRVPAADFEKLIG